jgi:hypothetical protein
MNKNYQRVFNILKALKPGESLAIQLLGPVTKGQVRIYNPGTKPFTDHYYSPFRENSRFNEDDLKGLKPAVLNDMLLEDYLKFGGKPQFHSGCFYQHIYSNTK